MTLEGKVAIVYGGGGAIGGTVARAFAREGARLFLVGRTLGPLEKVAREITAEGGTAEADQLDALDRAAVDRHAAMVAVKAGRIDVSLNAVGIFHVQGRPFAELSLEEFAHPVAAYARTNFLTAKAAARQMTRQGSGVIVMLSTPGSRMTGTGFLGNGVAYAAVEAFSRILAGELGASGIRVVCLRPDAIPESARGPHSNDVFETVARRHGTEVEAMLAGRARTATLLKRLPTLRQVADAAVFAASDGAGAMTGTVLNLTCGSLVD